MRLRVVLSVTTMRIVIATALVGALAMVLRRHGSLAAVAAGEMNCGIVGISYTL